MSDEKPMGQVIQIDEARIRDHLGELVRGTEFRPEDALSADRPWLLQRVGPSCSTGHGGINIAAPHFRTIQACPKDLPQGLREIELAANSLIGPSSWRMAMPTSEDYRQMANRSAQLAIGCSAPSVAQALLALGLEYMALAARLGEPAAMRQDPAGFGD